jgi:hypothetical protein
MALCACFKYKSMEVQDQSKENESGDKNESAPRDASGAESGISDWLVKSFVDGVKGSDEFRQLKQHLVTSLKTEIGEFAKNNADSLVDQQKQVHQLQETLKTKEEHIEALEGTVFELQGLLRRLTVKLESMEEDLRSPSSLAHSTSGSNDVTVDEFEAGLNAPKPAAFSIAHFFRGRADCHTRQRGHIGPNLSEDTIEQYATIGLD